MHDGKKRKKVGSRDAGIACEMDRERRRQGVHLWLTLFDNLSCFRPRRVPLGDVPRCREAVAVRRRERNCWGREVTGRGKRGGKNNEKTEVKMGRKRSQRKQSIRNNQSRHPSSSIKETRERWINEEMGEVSNNMKRRHRKRVESSESVWGRGEEEVIGASVSSRRLPSPSPTACTRYCGSSCSHSPSQGRCSPEPGRGCRSFAAGSAVRKRTTQRQ